MALIYVLKLISVPKSVLANFWLVGLRACIIFLKLEPSSTF